jgi:hypothetical protein
MTVNRTTLLDLPLPVTGTESNTWGDITNNGLTEYMDIAIAGMSNLTSANFTAGALTIETTEGNSAGTSITATSAQYAGFRVTSLAANSTITVGNTGTSPARSYRLINADATYNLTFKATGQTGVTLLPGQSAVVAFNGTDYVIVGTVGAGTATDNAITRFDGTTGEILQNSAATIDDTGAATFVGSVNVSGTSASAADLKLYEDTDNGTNYVAFKSPASVASNVTWTLPSADGTNGQALTTNGSGTLAFSSVTTAPGGSTTQVQYNNAGAFAGSSNLTFDGTNLTSGGTVTATKLIPTGNVTAGNGMYLPTTNTLAFSTDGSERMRITSAGVVMIGATSAHGSEKVLINGGGTSSAGDGYLTLRRGSDASNGSGVGVIDFADTRTSSIYAKIQAIADATPGTNDFPGALVFYTTADGASTTTERMRITSSGNLLVGTTSTSLASATSGTGLQYIPNNAVIVAANGGNSCLIANKTDSTTGSTAIFRYNGSTVGDISITSTNAAYNTASSSTNGAQLNYQGITFPATQSASSNANTLDDYEEGTWTPVLASFTGTSGRTLTGTYTKIGRLVYITVKISDGSQTLESTGNSSNITGLPFTVSGVSAFAGITTNYHDTINQGCGIYFNTTVIYTVTFSIAASRTIVISGTYEV